MIEIRKAIKNVTEQIISVMKNAAESRFMLFDFWGRESILESFATFLKTVNETEKSRIFI